MIPGFAIADHHAAFGWVAVDFCKACRKSAARCAWDAVHAKIGELTLENDS